MIEKKGMMIKAMATGLMRGSSPNARRRRRRHDVPIFARSSRQLGTIRVQPPKKATHLGQRNQLARTPAWQMVAPDSGRLGPWENSITNTIPSSEPFNQLSDFLYKEVVGKLNLNIRSARDGSTAGSFIEIEAKIGQLIDKKTNSRLVLPVMGEHVINRNDRSLHVNFESSMSDSQSIIVNEFVNKALRASDPKLHPVVPPANPRIPISYIHTRECDTFYELSQTGFLSLPLSIRSRLNPHHSRPKVRVTTDKKTGKVLAKIIKVRLADLDVYCPKSDHDFRVSINLEKDLDDQWRDLVLPHAKDAKPLTRSKDRMTYRHLAYRIDLTQVATSTDPIAKPVNELEVELSAADLCKHGMLLRDGQPNEYHKLVQGFLNNIRLLAKGSRLRK